GGTGAYTFNWSNSATTASITGVAAGTYSVTITDANGCTDSASVTITQPANLVTSIGSFTNETCIGDNDGAATASVTGGTAPFTYLWSDGSTASNNTGLGGGFYTVTVTDNNGCSATTFVLLDINCCKLDIASDTVYNAGWTSGLNGGAGFGPWSITAGTNAGTFIGNSQNNGATGGVGINTGGEAWGMFANTGDSVVAIRSILDSLQVGDKVGIQMDNGFIDNGGNVSFALQNSSNEDLVRFGFIGGSTNYFVEDSAGLSLTTIPFTDEGLDLTFEITGSSSYALEIIDLATNSTTNVTGTMQNPTGGQTIDGLSLVNNNAGTLSPRDAYFNNLKVCVRLRAIIDSTRNVACNGDTTGFASVSIAGGVAPFTYLWSNGATADSIVNVAAGNYTVTITDANGNTSSDSTTITEPTAIVAAVVLDSNVSCFGFSDGGATASATGGTGAYTYNWSNSATTASITGVTAGTYSVTITDAKGCTDSTSVTITQPVMLVAAAVVDSNVSCFGFSDGGATASATGGTMPYTYNWSNSATTASITGVMAGTYSVTITDANGCTDSTSVTITQPVMLVVSSGTINQVSCVGQSDGGATSTVTGGTLPYTYLWSNGGTNDSIAGVTAGTYTVTVTDNNGCSDTAVVAIGTTPDVTPPVVTCPGNISQNNDAGTCGAIVTYTVTTSDNCPGETLSQIAGLPSGATFPVGITTNTFVATDLAGNTDTCTFTVTVADTTAPVIACPANISQGNDAGQCSAVVTYTLPTATDNCINTSITQIAGLASGAVFPVGVTTNTFVATDSAGNADTCSFTVTVTDTSAPAITCPPSVVTINDAGLCSAVVSYAAPTAIDNCPGVVVTQIAGLASGAVFPVGTTTNTYVATDSNGNADTCSFDVTVNDAEAPTISCPANITQNNDAGQCSAVVTYTVITNDNCSGPILSQIGGLASGATFPVGTTTNTFVVTDSAGNSDTCSFDVTINDVEAPVITCPANITQANDSGACGAVISFALPTATDNCSNTTISQIGGLPSGSSYPVGVTTNTFVATDSLGNADTCSFTVTISDTTAPIVANCPANISLNNDPGLCTAVATWTAPTATDNCGIASFVSSHTPGSTFSAGTTTVTYTATDTAGNVSVCSFDVVVTDTEAPVITCPANVSTNNDAGLCSAVVSFTAPSISDNCPGATLTQLAGLPSGSAFPVGITTNTFVATDVSGNTDTCSFTVEVVDTELPTIACPANISVSNDPGACGATVTYTAPVGADNCPGSTTALISGLGSGSLFPIGVTVETYEVTDASGNTDTCSFTVTVVDSEAPVIVCPADVVVGNDLNQCGAVVTFTAPVVTDNCPGAIVTQIAGFPSGSTYPVGVTINQFVASDSAGNSDTCSFTVTVTDNEAPSITGCPADITINNDAGICGALVSWTIPQATDNCGIDTLIVSHTSGAIFPVGVTTVSYIAIDTAGNSDTCSFTITILDNEAPTIVCPADIVSCDEVVFYTPPVGTDNCSGGLTTNQIAGLGSGSTFPIGVTTETYVVTDSAGNSDTCSFTVTVNARPNPGEDGAITVCVNDAGFDLIDILNGTPDAGGSWTDPDGQPHSGVFTPGSDLAGDYVYTVPGLTPCPDSSAIVSVTVYDLPLVDAGPDFTITKGEEVATLQPNVSATAGNIEYLWTPTTFLNFPASENPDASPPETTVYTLTVTLDGLCPVTDSMTVNVTDSITIYTLVTPNNDQINDEFKILGISNYPNAKVVILDKWQGVVYESVGYDDPWDGTNAGKELPFGPYFYIIELNDPENRTFTGSITLLK
ncbi:MAG: HYR domain-containing protein, partial [Salibacteraceae bacterium]